MAVKHKAENDKSRENVLSAAKHYPKTCVFQQRFDISKLNSYSESVTNQKNQPSPLLPLQDHNYITKLTGTVYEIDSLEK